MEGISCRSVWERYLIALMSITALALAQLVMSLTGANNLHYSFCAYTRRGANFIVIGGAGRDSNPRYGYPYTRFPSERLQPLGHSSVARLMTVTRPIVNMSAQHFAAGTRRGLHYQRSNEVSARAIDQSGSGLRHKDAWSRNLRRRPDWPHGRERAFRSFKRRRSPSIALPASIKAIIHAQIKILWGSGCRRDLRYIWCKPERTDPVRPADREAERRLGAM